MNIKKLLKITMAIAIITILAPVKTYSQEGGLDIGLRLGTSISYFGETSKFEGGNPGLVAGAGIQLDVLSFLGVGAELTFHQQRGTRNEMPVVDPTVTRVTQRNLTLNALEIPIFASIKLAELNSARLVFKPGYSFSYTMGVVSRDVNHYYFADGNYVVLRGSENLTSDYSKVQHALLGSLGLEVPLETGLFSKISLDVRYRKGLSDIETSYSVLSSRTSRVKSQSLQVVLGVSF